MGFLANLLFTVLVPFLEKKKNPQNSLIHAGGQNNDLGLMNLSRKNVTCEFSQKDFSSFQTPVVPKSPFRCDIIIQLQ